MGTRVVRRLRGNQGTSYLIALAFLLICACVSAVIVSSATVNSEHNSRQAAEQQAYLSATSALAVASDVVASKDGDLGGLALYKPAGSASYSALVPSSDEARIEATIDGVTYAPAGGSIDALQQWAIAAATAIASGQEPAAYEAKLEGTGAYHDEDVDLTFSMISPSYAIQVVAVPAGAQTGGGDGQATQLVSYGGTLNRVFPAKISMDSGSVGITWGSVQDAATQPASPVSGRGSTPGANAPVDDDPTGLIPPAPVDDGKTYVSVTFDANGGTFADGSATTTVSVEEGTAIASLPVATLPGKTFQCWADGAYVFNPETIVTGAMTLVAEWESQPCTVRFALQYVSGSGEAAYIATYGSAANQTDAAYQQKTVTVSRGQKVRAADVPAYDCPFTGTVGWRGGTPVAVWVYTDELGVSRQLDEGDAPTDITVQGNCTFAKVWMPAGSGGAAGKAAGSVITMAPGPQGSGEPYTFYVAEGYSITAGYVKQAISGFTVPAGATIDHWEVDGVAVDPAGYVPSGNTVFTAVWATPVSGARASSGLRAAVNLFDVYYPSGLAGVNYTSTGAELFWNTYRWTAYPAGSSNPTMYYLSNNGTEAGYIAMVYDVAAGTYYAPYATAAMAADQPYLNDGSDNLGAVDDVALQLADASDIAGLLDQAKSGATPSNSVTRRASLSVGQQPSAVGRETYAPVSTATWDVPWKKVSL